MVSLLDKWRLLMLAAADPDIAPVAVEFLAVALDGCNRHTGATDGKTYAELARAMGRSERRAMEAAKPLERRGYLTIARPTQGSKAACVFGFNFGLLEQAPHLSESTPDHLSKVTPDDPPSPVESDTCSPVESDTPQVSKVTPRPFTHVHPGKSTQVHRSAEQKRRRSNPLLKSDRKSDSAGRSRKSGFTDSEIEAAFAEWWCHYPRRVAKGAARKAYVRVVTSGKATPAELLAGAMRYAAARQNDDPKFTKHPATWLNGECWADAPESVAPSGTGPPRGGRDGWRDFLANWKPGDLA